MRAFIAIAALGLLAVALGALDQPATPNPEHRPARPTVASTPAPLARASAALDRAQARHDRAQTRAEQRVAAARPLLGALPIEHDGVRIDLSGLAGDDRHVVLSLDPGDGSRAHARDVYRRTLRRHGDSGRGYRLEWTR